MAGNTERARTYVVGPAEHAILCEQGWLAPEDARALAILYGELVEKMASPNIRSAWLGRWYEIAEGGSTEDICGTK